MNWKQAFTLGLLAPGVWEGVGEATMYSYNGVVLPKISEFEKAPYCLLVSPSQVVYSSIPIIVYPDEQKVSCGGSMGYRTVQTLKDGVWQGDAPSVAFTETKYIYNGLYWANHDVADASGTVYLSASDPIPVYE